MSDPRPEAQPDPGLVLFAVAHGRPHTLYRWASEHVEEHIQSVGESDAWDEAIHLPANGIWVAELRIVDDGPSDWPGARDCRLEASEMRPPTADEWSRFVAEEYVWDGEMDAEPSTPPKGGE